MLLITFLSNEIFTTLEVNEKSLSIRLDLGEALDKVEDVEKGSAASKTDT